MSETPLRPAGRRGLLLGGVAAATGALALLDRLR